MNRFILFAFLALLTPTAFAGDAVVDLRPGASTNWFETRGCLVLGGNTYVRAYPRQFLSDIKGRFTDAGNPFQCRVGTVIVVGRWREWDTLTNGIPASAFRDDHVHFKR